MAWNGWFTYGGTEIINSSRVETYAKALGMPWVKTTGASSGLRPMLGHAAYVTPAADLAPWYDPDDIESGRFAGLIPIDVNGIEDSTRSADVFEFTSDGGHPGRLRHTTKTVVFSAALVGLTEASVEYGFRWLKRALMRRQCAPGATKACVGEDLQYARMKPPVVGGTTATFQRDYVRMLRDVVVTRGPVINSKREMKGCNGVVWIVSFTAVAGDPFEYGTAIPVLDDMISKVAASQPPYAAGVTTGAAGSTTYTYAPCPVKVTTPIYDPDFSPFTAPPQAPDLMPGGWVTPVGTQNRMYAVLPANLVPLWDEVRPIIRLTGGTADHRMIRVRFYDGATPVGTNCGDVGEYVVSYLPAGYTLVIDTAQEAVMAYTTDGVVRRADALVFGAGAKPITWFGLSCGNTWLATVDSDDPITDFNLDLDLVPRSA